MTRRQGRAAGLRAGTAASALMLWIVAQPSPEAAYAQAEGVVPAGVDIQKVEKAAAICADVAQPPPMRVASCRLVLTMAVMRDKARAKVLIDLAFALTDLGKVDEASAEFNRAVILDPTNQLASFGLHETPTVAVPAGVALQVRKAAAICADGTQLPAVRVSSCTQVLRLPGLRNQAHARLLDDRAIALSALGKRDEAIADFTHAITLDPSDLLAYSGRSQVYSASSRWSLAIADLSHLVSADPTNGEALYYRGVAYERSGELGKAQDDYRGAVRLLSSAAPENAASENRGVANEKLGNLESAIADYSRSIERAPSAAGYFNRATTYERLQQPDKALADFNAALRIDPKFVPALLGRADENYANRRLPASLEDYTRVVQAEPSNAAAYFQRGNVHSDLRDFAAAYADYSQSLKLNPNQPDVLYNRAVAAERMGRLKDAESDRRRASELDTSGAATD